MLLITRFLAGLRALFRRSDAERELDDELRGFFEAAVDEKMRAGMPRHEAVRAARLELGSADAVKDWVRDVGWESALESCWQDVRYGGRMLRRSPGFAAVAIAILALGIGANTAIFSLVNTVMLRALPVREPAQLVQLLSAYPGEPRSGGFPWKVYEHFREHNHVFSDLIGVSPARFRVTGDGGDAEVVSGEYVTGNYFAALGVQPAIGRLIAPQDDESADPAAAVVSWSYWKNRFNLDPAILGRRMVVEGLPVTVVGVAPRAFSGIQVGLPQDIWVPIGVSGRLGVGQIARLKPGVSLEQARAEMRVLNQWRVEELARTSKDPMWRRAGLDLEPAGSGAWSLRDYVGRPLLVLMAVVGLVLLMACANVASMLLARGATRTREMAVRVSLGAGRARLVRQMLTESLLLSAAGAALGIVLAYFGAAGLARTIASGRPLPSIGQFDIRPELDLKVLLFTGMVAVLTSVLFGLAPAWHAFVSAPMSSLREIASRGETRSRRAFGKTLVVAQVALSVVVLSAAGLFVGHLSNLRNLDLGFERDSVLLVTLDPARSGYQANQLSDLYRDLLDRLRTIPGVRSATLSAVTPIHGAGASRFVSVQGFEEPPDARRRASLNWVGPTYFATFGTPILAGRDFRPEDEGGPRVAIVSQAMARYYFGERNPIGQHFTFEGQSVSYEIVGVSGDAKYSDLHEAAPRTIYLNVFQDLPGRAHRFALRTDVPPLAVTGDVRRLTREVLKTVPVAGVTTLADQVDASIVPERLMAMLSSLFAILGALLAALGLYGLLAYTVARRVNEIGVRMALGATQRDVTRMVLNGALRLVCVGLLVGVPLAVWSRRFASSMVPNLSVDPVAAVAVSALAMVAVTVLAAYVPARRAARVTPTEALRHS